MGSRPAMIKVMGFGVGAAALIALAVYLTVAPLRIHLFARGAVGPQQVVISMGGFAPQYLRLHAGVPVTLVLVNSDSRFHTDGGWHQFAIDALKLDVRIAPQSQKTVTLSPLSPGRYEFYCDICCGGKANPTMRGILEIRG